MGSKCDPDRTVVLGSSWSSPAMRTVTSMGVHGNSGHCCLHWGDLTPRVAVTEKGLKMYRSLCLVLYKQQCSDTYRSTLNVPRDTLPTPQHPESEDLKRRCLTATQEALIGDNTWDAEARPAGRAWIASLAGGTEVGRILRKEQTQESRAVVGTADLVGVGGWYRCSCSE